MKNIILLFFIAILTAYIGAGLKETQAKKESLHMSTSDMSTSDYDISFSTIPLKYSPRWYEISQGFGWMHAPGDYIKIPKKHFTKTKEKDGWVFTDKSNDWDYFLPKYLYREIRFNKSTFKIWEFHLRKKYQRRKKDDSRRNMSKGKRSNKLRGVSCLCSNGKE